MSDTAPETTPAPQPTEWPMTAQEARDITVRQIRLQELQAEFNAIGTQAAQRLGLEAAKGMRFDIERCVWLAQTGPQALPRADEASK